MTRQADRNALEAMRAQAEDPSAPAAAVVASLRRGAAAALCGAALCAALAAAWFAAAPQDWRAVAVLSVSADAQLRGTEAARAAMSADAILRAVDALPAEDRADLARERPGPPAAAGSDAERLAAARALAPRLTAVTSRDGDALAVLARAVGPERAERFAAAAAAGYLEMQEQEARRRAARGLGWIESRLQHVASRLAAARLRDGGASELATLASMRDSLSAMLQDAARDAARQGSGVALQRPAEAAATPEGPRAGPTTALAGVFGAALFLLLHRMQERLRGIPETPGALARECGLPVLAALPRMRRSADFAAMARREPGGEEAEAARSLRAPLLRAAERRVARRRAQGGDQTPGGLVLAVAGGGLGAEAGPVAALLAESYARAGRRVCLVDADLRAPDQAARYGLEGEADLLAALDGDVALDRALWPADVPELTVLPAAPAGAARAEALSERAAEELIAALRARFDLVVLAAPAPETSADGRALAGLADATLAVFRWGAAGREQLRSAAQALRVAGASPAGVALTGATGPARARRSEWGRGRYAAFAEGFAK